MTGPQTARAVDKFLACFEEVKKLHVAVLGKSLEMYKATEPACLEAALDELFASKAFGVAFVADAVNTLLWKQCLGNGNHRTTILFMRTFPESCAVAFPYYASEPDAQVRFEASMDSWTKRSQASIRRRGEPGFAQTRPAPRHKEITEEWVAQALGAQSDVLMMVGPQRLMDFIS